jgi:hypothetical protein
MTDIVAHRAAKWEYQFITILATPFTSSNRRAAKPSAAMNLFPADRSLH